MTNELEAFGVGVVLGVIALFALRAFCKWVGRVNDLIAADGYRKVTEEHLRKAVDSNRNDYWRLAERVEKLEHPTA